MEGERERIGVIHCLGPGFIRRTHSSETEAVWRLRKERGWCICSLFHRGICARVRDEWRGLSLLDEGCEGLWRRVFVLLYLYESSNHSCVADVTSLERLHLGIFFLFFFFPGEAFLRLCQGEWEWAWASPPRYFQSPLEIFRQVQELSWNPPQHRHVGRWTFIIKFALALDL